MSTSENWVMFARWSTGEATDDEYADDLESRPGYDPNGPDGIFVERLRRGTARPDVSVYEQPEQTD